jgi:outer membrane lipoprotein SlyB
MEAQVKKAPHPLMWVVGVAIVLFCAAGIAAIMGWIPTSMGGSGDDAAFGKLQEPRTGTAKPAAANARTAEVPPGKLAAKVRTNQVQAPGNAPAKPKCAECGVIESTREVATQGEGSGLGAVGGAVVGGLLGSQVGGGRGQDIATVVGAVGGAVAGNAVEKRVKSTSGYEVTVRLEDGSTRVIPFASAPAWRTGDPVKVVDGAIRSN